MAELIPPQQDPENPGAPIFSFELGGSRAMVKDDVPPQHLPPTWPGLSASLPTRTIPSRVQQDGEGGPCTEHRSESLT